MLARLAELAVEKGSTNIAFAAYLSLSDVDACIEVLEKAGRLSEAALFARTYAPSKVSGIVGEWRKELESTNRHKQNEIAASIADPSRNEDVFEEGWKESTHRRPYPNTVLSASGSAASIVPSGFKYLSGLNSKGSSKTSGSCMIAQALPMTIEPPGIR